MSVFLFQIIRQLATCVIDLVVIKSESFSTDRLTLVSIFACHLLGPIYLPI